MDQLNLDGVITQDIKLEAISKEDLDLMIKLSGSVNELFSRRAMKYRSMGLNEREVIESEMKKLILEEYTFLKRPVAIIEEKIFIGSAKKTVESLKDSLNT